MIVDVIYGHAGMDFPYYDAYTRLRSTETPSWARLQKILQQLQKKH